jgi:hypothetical protein
MSQASSAAAVKIKKYSENLSDSIKQKYEVFLKEKKAATNAELRENR